MAVKDVVIIIIAATSFRKRVVPSGSVYDCALLMGLFVNDKVTLTVINLVILKVARIV